MTMATYGKLAFNLSCGFGGWEHDGKIKEQLGAHILIYNHRQRVNSGKHRKSNSLTDGLLQQDPTSQSFPKSSVHWELSVKIYEPRGVILIQTTILCTHKIGENVRRLVFLQFDTRAIWEEMSLEKILSIRLAHRQICEDIFSIKDWCGRAWLTVDGATRAKVVLGCVRKKSKPRRASQ